MILSDRDIKRYIDSGKLLIDPLNRDTIRENGVDLRIGGAIARLKRINKSFDPRRDDPSEFIEVVEGDEFIIYPNEHVLLHTMEYIKLPKDLMAFVNLRSSYARIGLIIPPTIVDANFEGELTIELIGGNFPVVLHKGDRFLHLIFAKLLSIPEKPYMGKYQGQKGVQIPIFKESPPSP